MLPEIFPTQTTDNTACALATRSEGCGVEGGKLDTITDNLRVPLSRDGDLDTLALKLRPFPSSI